MLSHPGILARLSGSIKPRRLIGVFYGFAGGLKVALANAWMRRFRFGVGAIVS